VVHGLRRDVPVTERSVICSASRVAQAWRQPPRPHYRPIDEHDALPTPPQGDIISVMSVEWAC
jgi:hypothetical protein